MRLGSNRRSGEGEPVWPAGYQAIQCIDNDHRLHEEHRQSTHKAGQPHRSRQVRPNRGGPQPQIPGDLGCACANLCGKMLESWPCRSSSRIASHAFWSRKSIRTVRRRCMPPPSRRRCGRRRPPARCPTTAIAPRVQPAGRISRAGRCRCSAPPHAPHRP